MEMKWLFDHLVDGPRWPPLLCFVDYTQRVLSGWIIVWRTWLIQNTFISFPFSPPHSQPWKSMCFLSGPRSFAYPKRKCCEQREEQDEIRSWVDIETWPMGFLVIQTSCVKCRNITDRPYTPRKRAQLLGVFHSNSYQSIAFEQVGNWLFGVRERQFTRDLVTLTFGNF